MRILRTIPWAGLAVFVVLSGACAHVPDLEPHIAHIEIEEQIDQASVIAVGVIEEEYLVRNLTDADGTKIGLYAVNVQLEGILKGQLDKGQAEAGHLTFYYYQAYGAWNGPSPNFIVPGERDIFYLIQDQGVLRATNDVFLSHTPIWSGKHPVSPVSDDQLQEAVARLLILPGAEPRARYLDLVRGNAALAMGLVGDSEVREMLRGLLDYPDGAIRARACLNLADFPFKDKSCLAKIINDAQTSPEDRERARELLEPRAKP